MEFIKTIDAIKWKDGNYEKTEEKELLKTSMLTYLLTAYLQESFQFIRKT